MPVLGGVAWAAALAAQLLSPLVLVVVAALGGLLLGWRMWRGRSFATVAAWWVIAIAVAGGVLLRGSALTHSPVAALAHGRAEVELRLRVSSDPAITVGKFGSRTMFHATVRSVTGRGRTWSVRTPVLVFGPVDGRDGPGERASPEAARWRALQYAESIVIDARLAGADDPDLAAIVSARGSPHVVGRPSLLVRWSTGLRAGVRAAVAGAGEGPRALVPALVDGDKTALAAATQDEFRTTGLTHLLAVSGTNLTLVVGFLLLVARGLGVRARGLTVVGLVGVAGFVLIARAEPSVVRAAVMGGVALIGMGDRARGCRALGACVVALMLFDPGLARSAGFALSALATGGILFLAPGWRDALARWMPRWLAEAIAVPMAAQLACTPVIAALSGQISLVAVLANLLAAPAVAPATVLGLAGGVLATVVPLVGRIVALPAAWSASWIIGVAHRTATLPVPAWSISTGPLTLAALALACLVGGLVLHLLLRHRGVTVLGCVVLGVCVLVPMPTPGWPPRDWIMLGCDVGQGDAWLLRVAPGAAVVVDTGPDPDLIRRCMDDLHITSVPVLVLTHFHADHVDGLPGALAGRSVGLIETTPYRDPPGGAAFVDRVARSAHVRESVVRYGEARAVGALRWQVLAPSEPAPTGSDSPPNDDSVVLYVRTHRIGILMMGDEETLSQEQLHAIYPGLRVDVLKVAHHGSAKQDPDLVRSLGAKVGLISVGKNNDYGHPTPSLLALLASAHIRAFRTDQDGALAVVDHHGMEVVTQH